MSAANIIARKGRTLIRRRKAQGTYVDGFYTEDNTVSPDLEIIGSVQPLGYKEKMLLPEGDRTKEWIKVYTVADVQTMTEDRQADILVVDGKSYEVQQVTNWTLPAGGANLTHYEVNACTMNEKTNKVD